MDEVGWLIDIGKMIRTDAGLSAFILFIFVVVSRVEIYNEKKYSRQAWKSHNEIAKETNEALNKFSLAITLLSERKGH